MDLWIRLALGIGIVVVVVTTMRFLQPRLETRLADLRSPSFGSVFSKLIQIGVNIVAVAVALTIVAPGIDLAGMLAGAGLLTVAAGFAFQDILSNLLAGILLIFRQPFVKGDQIEVNGIAGTIEGITLRETQITTFQGRRVFVPNKDVYENAITVQTHDEAVRTDLEVGVAYGTDLEHAEQVAIACLADLDEVHEDPAPVVRWREFAGSSINFQLRYFSGSSQAEQVAARSAVIKAVNDAFEAEGIEIPYDILTIEPGSDLADVLG